MIVDCSLSQDLVAGEIWIMAFEFELDEAERTKEVRDNIIELYANLSKLLDRRSTWPTS